MSYFLLMLLLFTSIISAAGDYYPSYQDCAPSPCGNSTIQYPFGTCGLLPAHCLDAPEITLLGSGSFFLWVGRVREIAKSAYSSGTLQITPSYIDPLEYEPSLAVDYSSSYDWLSKGGFFNLSDADMLGTIVNCTEQPAGIFLNGSLAKLDCTASNRYCFFYPKAGFQIPSCHNYPIVVPTNKSYSISADKGFKQLHRRGFQIKWSNTMILVIPVKPVGEDVTHNSPLTFITHIAFVLMVMSTTLIAMMDM